MDCYPDMNEYWLLQQAHLHWNERHEGPASAKKVKVQVPINKLE